MAVSTPKFFGEKRVKTLWEEICEEFAAQHHDYELSEFDDNASVATDVTQYSARRHTPVVYGQLVHQTPVDADVSEDFDPAIGHPAAVGLTMITKPKPSPSPQPEPPDQKTCTPREYLESYIFPTLCAALEAMLKQAKLEKCFERKQTRFNGCDFLTEYLYKNNPYKKAGECNAATLWEIPFVKEWNAKHPRKPLPLSLQWTEEEAAVIIQAYYRGHLVRCQPEVSELRKWQKDWREENRNVRREVEQFWEDRESKAFANEEDKSKGKKQSRSSKSGGSSSGKH